MRRLGETVVFSGIALTAHVLFFLQSPPAGAQSSGQSGEALVALTGATAQMQQLVQEWVQSPQVAETPPEIAQSPTPPMVEAPEIPAREVSAAPMVLPSMVTPPPPAPQEPTLQTQAPPPPPPTAAPVTSQRPQTRPERSTSQAAAPEQRAAGSGGGAQSGVSGTSVGSTLSPARATELQAIWGANIRARIERRKRFPSGVRGSGQVIVSLTVSRTGQLMSHGVTQSSGNPAFDQAALQAVARAGQFPPAPAELSQSGYRFSLRIDFSR